MTKINCKFTTLERKNLMWKETWLEDDKGLIKNYEVGRNLAKNNIELSEKVKRGEGELSILGYKGESDKILKLKTKIGTLNYLAQWQALRGENLEIDIDEKVVLTCSKTGIEVTFTMDLEKLKN